MASSASARSAAGVKTRDVEPASGAAQGGGDAAPLESGPARPAEPAQGDPAPPTPLLRPVASAPRAARLSAEPRRLRRPPGAAG